MADILIGNVRGPQGVQGDPGEQGVQGEAATIEVGTVSTTAYGNPAQVTNSGTAEEAVLDFVIPAGRPGEETTSMSALTLDTITAQTAAFPVPAVGERGAVVFGKIIKFFTDTVSSLANKLNISDVVNNLTSTATNKPLSAAQGKALNDALVKRAAVKFGAQTFNIPSSNWIQDPAVGGYRTLVTLGINLSDPAISLGTLVAIVPLGVANASNAGQIGFASWQGDLNIRIAMAVNTITSVSVRFAVVSTE